MKNLLFIILVVVTIVLLWAIRAEAYSSGLVFLLGLLVAALSSYLIADYFFKVEKKSLKDTLHVSQKENQALKERVDLLQTQLNTATTHTEIEPYEQRIFLLEDEKNKLDGLSRAQTAEIASLREKLDELLKNHSKLQEDNTVATETSHSQSVSLQEEIAAIKLKNQALVDENTALHTQNAGLIAELDTKMSNKASDIQVEQGDITTDDYVVISRGLGDIELETEDADDEMPMDYGTSDNLQAIDGIDEKIAAVLKDADIPNWETLSMTTPERLRVVLDNAGLNHIYPSSWPEQARLLVHGEFSKLKKYKSYIAGEI